MSAGTIHISSRHRLFDLKLGEVWKYRNLVWMFTSRHFAVMYKQTILGPLWLFVNPLLSSVFQVILFGNIAKLSTDGIPQLLFYFTGNTLWGFFSSCVSSNAATFSGNSHLFGKIYFPRLVVPLAAVFSAGIRFGIQMLFVLALLGYYLCKGMVSPHWEAWLLLPLFLLQLGLLGMGVGIAVSSVTTKYRDLSILVSFGLQLWMYATPVVYPLSAVPGRLRSFLRWNPVTAPVELFRHGILGTGAVPVEMLVYSWVAVLVAAIGGILLFNKVERNFIDTI